MLLALAHAALAREGRSDFACVRCLAVHRGTILLFDSLDGAGSCNRDRRRSSSYAFCSPTLRCVRHEECQTVLEIADNGTGISEENLGRIFEPFFTTKQIGKGTGLGLYVSYGLIRENGGDISVANRTNGGAIFTVTIPLEPNDG